MSTKNVFGKNLGMEMRNLIQSVLQVYNSLLEIPFNIILELSRKKKKNISRKKKETKLRNCSPKGMKALSQK